MPYFIEADALLATFPKPCAYCGAADASSTFRQPFSKLRLSKIPGAAESETLTIDLPACDSCSHWFRYTRVLLYLAGFVALTGLLWAVLASMWFDNAIPVYIWVATIGAWVVLRLWRGWRRKALRLAYFNDKQAVYEAKDEGYAKQLAELNGLTVSKKWVLVKLS